MDGVDQGGLETSKGNGTVPGSDAVVDADFIPNQICPKKIQTAAKKMGFCDFTHTGGKARFCFGKKVGEETLVSTQLSIV